MACSFQHTAWKNNGITLRGSLFMGPDTQAPWIIFCHGFTSHRIGPRYLFVYLARACAAAGINALTFDFMGCGESDGAFADTTMSTLCSDCQSACCHISGMFTPAKTLLLGHSFGGTVAVLSASACKPDGVILIAPLAFVRKHVHEHAPILEKGMNTNGNYEFGPLELKRDFLDEIGACDPVAAFSKEAIPTALILHGENDSQILPEESQRYVTRAHACGVPCASIPVKQADHLFSTVASRLFLQKTITTWALEVTQ